MVIVVAVPSRIGFGVVAVGVVIVGAGSAKNSSVTTPDEPPLVFTTVADWKPVVVVGEAGSEIVPRNWRFGVTSVTVVVPSVSVTVARAKKPEPTIVNGTPVEPIEMAVGTSTLVTSSVQTDVLFKKEIAGFDCTGTAAVAAVESAVPMVKTTLLPPDDEVNPAYV